MRLPEFGGSSEGSYHMRFGGYSAVFESEFSILKWAYVMYVGVAFSSFAWLLSPSFGRVKCAVD